MLEKELALTASNLEDQNNLGKKNWASTKLGKIVAGSILTLEVSPLNEISRLAALAYAQKTFGDPTLVAGIYAGATLAIEGVGGIVTADVLDTPGAQSVISKVNNRLDKVGISKFLHTDALTEGSIAMIAGTPVATIVKHRQDPERTRSQNRYYSTVVSVGVSAVCGAQGFAVSEGISHPSPETIGLAGLGAASFLATWKWARRRLKKVQEEKRLRGEPDSNTYKELMNSYPSGPQLGGFSDIDIEKVMTDQRTVFLELEGDKLDRWPILTPISNNTEFIEEYFTGRFDSQADVYYLNMPPKVLYEQSVKHTAITDQIAERLMEKSIQNSIFVVEEAAEDNKLADLMVAFKKKNGNLEIAIDDLRDPKNDTAAAVIHFEGKTVVDGESLPDQSIVKLRQAYQEIIEPSTRHKTSVTKLINPQEIISEDGQNPLLEKLWTIYNLQFSQLIENHPARQAQNYAEFSSMLQSQETLTLVHFEAGEPVAFTAFTDVKDCDWLNPNFYKKKFKDELVLYFPGIASDPNKKGHMHAAKTINLVAKILKAAHAEAHIVFQCTNISANYIPRIVVRAGDVPGHASIPEVNEFYRYNYKAFRVVSSDSVEPSTS